MTTVEVLREARALVEKGWTQWRFAQDVRGAVTDIWGTFRPPVAFCARGAIFHVCGDGGGDSESAERLLWAATGVWPLTHWNDAPGRTQAEVIAAFDRAILLAAGPLAPAVQDQERKP